MRPTILHVGGVLYWTIQTRDPDTMVLKDADSTPTVAVRKNGASVGDSVTITKRSATTGLYDCSYNPASEVEGDSFQFEESAAVTGTTTSSATYVNQFSVQVRALERGTDGALQPTIASRTLNVSVDGEGDAVLDTATQAILNNIPTNSELTTALAAADDAVLAAISALNNLSAAQVNAELLDVLSVDTFAELSAPPSASSSLKDKLVYLFMWARNKATQTTTERKLYADDGTTVVSTESVSDTGGTFTKGEAS